MWPNSKLHNLPGLLSVKLCVECTVWYTFPSKNDTLICIIIKIKTHTVSSMWVDVITTSKLMLSKNNNDH